MLFSHFTGHTGRLLSSDSLPLPRAVTALVLGSVFWLAGCQHQALAPAPAPTDAPSAGEETAESAETAADDSNAYEQSQTYYQVLLGQLAQQRGEQQIALSNLLAAAESSRNLNLARQAFSLALKQRDPEATLRAARLLAALDSQNPEAKVALALAELQNEQTDAARLSLAAALAQVGSNENGQIALIGKFSRAAGPASLPLLSELAREHPQPEWVLLAAAVQAQHFGDAAYAMALLDRAMEQAPDYRRALLVKAELLAGRDGEAAIALLDEAYRQQPDDAELAVAYGRTLYSQGRFPEAVTVLRAHAKDEDNKDAGYLYAVSQFMAGDWAGALPRLQALAESGEQTGPAGWLCAQAAERLQRFELAHRCYDLVQPGDNQYPAARRAKAELLSKAKQFDAALDVLTEARRALDSQPSEDNRDRSGEQVSLLASQLRVFRAAGQTEQAREFLVGEVPAYRQQPEPALLAIAMAQDSGPAMLAAIREQWPESDEGRRQWALTGANLLQQDGYLEQAYELIDELLSQQPDNLDLLYARALLAEPLGRLDQTEADLRRVLALDPNHIDALNALGYTLADHNRQLDEAYGLIERALRARPTSAAIMDSVGWVHYRRGDLAQARDWLHRAHALEPEAEIAAHYGEVLYRLGDKKKARQIWRDALVHTPENKVLNAIVERFK